MSEDLFSVVAALSLIALLYRYFFTSHAAPPSGPSSSSSRLSPLQRRAQQVPRAQVDRLLGMFPQCSEEELRYALVTVRGGAEAVAERVLTRGGLEPPPRGFFPPRPTPPSTAAAAAAAAAPGPATARPAAFAHPTHISRLGLSAIKAAQDEAFANGQGWRYERQDGDGEKEVKRRKERMVLEARWALLQKGRVA